MNKWTELGLADIPNNGGQLKLSQRDQEFSIRLSGVRGELMNSRVHGSEEALAELGCAGLKTSAGAHVLVGGLGMGFTLAAALKAVSATATVTVAELIPEVVEWNRGPLGDCAGNPLGDSRSQIYAGDVSALIASQQSTYDSIMLDVDNGPEGLTHTDNDQLYSLAGLQNMYTALKTQGMLAVWSAGPDPMFLIRLKKAKFHVSSKVVRARPGKGSRHTIFLARRGPALLPSRS
jgi:spermidine synthase